MKYCPYCGVSLLGGAVSFCAECGKPTPGTTQFQSNNPSNRDSKKAKKKKVFGKNPEPKPQKKQPSDDAISPNPRDDGYDGYYDDVRPMDNGYERERMDPELIKKVCMVAGGALLIIGLSVVMMLLL